ncbi:LytTR family DNA-binding domain-containing protein [Haloplasma contractile]|uniref:Autolysin response regulator protein n=1 Tax=Haloplasma contractile SSD-17B TaxID=1033810 RepID=U2FIE7_9MOLU|nr:LytTR family DNA-binding domain-containing protein [Haloplasma contractile]ERJ10999.1 Autolysin response regulator protein [Haloplasma contractile SSD-17B]
MNVKIVSNKQNYNKIKEKLEKGGFSICEDSQFVFYDHTAEVNHLIGKIDQEYEIIPINDIIYIESFSHDIFIHTEEEQYTIKEKLYQLEGMLESKGFMRANQSTIINKQYIKRIRPTLNSKFILKMKNGARVDITRSYYFKFKLLMNI